MTVVIDPDTEIIADEGMITTVGGAGSYIHFARSQQIDETFNSGVTAMIDGGIGSATDTYATTCAPGPWYIQRVL